MKVFLNGFTSGLGRAFGRILAYFLIGLLVYNFISKNKSDIKSTISNDIKEVINLE